MVVEVPSNQRHSCAMISKCTAFRIAFFDKLGQFAIIALGLCQTGKGPKFELSNRRNIWDRHLLASITNFFRSSSEKFPVAVAFLIVVNVS